MAAEHRPSRGVRQLQNGHVVNVGYSPIAVIIVAAFRRGRFIFPETAQLSIARPLKQMSSTRLKSIMAF
jgi:hypothetical protein